MEWLRKRKKSGPEAKGEEKGGMQLAIHLAKKARREIFGNK